MSNPRRRAALSLLTGAVSAALALSGCASSSTALSGRQANVRSQAGNVSFHKCGSDCKGTDAGAKYSIVLPQKWNGTLLLYSHGYRFAQPGPPDFGQPSTAAQVSSVDSDGAGQDPVSKRLLAQGYALAGSSYKSNGWAVADGVAADEALHARFVKLVGTPKRTYVWGDSLGGLITELVAEKHPDWVDGAAPMCGAVAGPNLNLDLALDIAFAIKTLIDPSLKLTGFTSDAEANANWTAARAALTKAAGDTAAGGTAKVLFIAALVDAAAKTETYDGSDTVSVVKATVESLLTGLAYGTAGRYEVEQRVGGDPSDNTRTDYSARINAAEAAVVKTVGGNAAAYEAQLASAPRVTADAAARSKFTALGDPSGAITVPTLTMHTEADPLVLVQNESVLLQRAQTKNDSGRLVQLYVAPPKTYPESSGAPYGAGHCNFSDAQRVGLVDTLNSWVRDGVYPVPVGVAPRFGPGLDATFTPPSWPAGTGG
jgi:alpha-beta hydrolase superfamily lysophospholipase